MADDLRDQLQAALSGTYVLDRELGGGGMARVFLATESALRRRVVVKVLPPEMTSAVSAERFRREIELAAQLRHPLIVPLLSAGEAGDVLSFTMPYIEGESLRARLARQGELPVAEATRVLRDVLEALAFAHRNATTHRDIKPENLLLDSASGHALLADFGVAKALGAAGVDASELTGVGMAVGTPAYMAPEVVSADPTADHRADLYSVGVIAYEALTGSHPLAGRPPHAVLLAHATETPEALSKRRPNVSPALADLVMRLLEKRPADRPQSADEVLRDLETVTTPGAQARESASRPQTPGLEWLDLGLRHTKRHAFKYVAVAVALALIGVAVTYRSISKESALPAPAGTRDRIARSVPNAKSLAVLPFVSIGPVAETEYFSDGLTDELIAALSKVGGLKVIARTSAFALKGKGLDVRTVADTLGVANVLEGTVRHAGNRVKVTVQLASAADNTILWSETYDRDLKDVFALQDEIARAIVSALRVTLGASAPIVQPATQDTAAYTLYLKGRYHWQALGREGLSLAVQYFEQATVRDPAYTRAYVGLADAYALLGIFGYRTPAEVLPQARAASRTALALDSTLGAAHATLAHILFVFDWKWKESEREFKRAIALDPQDVNGRVRYAVSLQDQGRFGEAIAQLDTARSIDPLDASIPNILGRVFVNARQPDPAIKNLREALELRPRLDVVLALLGHAYLQKRMPREAIASFREAAELSGVRDSAHLAYAYAVTGNPSEAATVLRTLLASASSRYLPPFHIAMAYAGLGESNEAMRWLEKAYDERASFMDGVKVTPAFDPLHSDPRFVQLLRRMGLEP